MFCYIHLSHAKIRTLFLTPKQFMTITKTKDKSIFYVLHENIYSWDAYKLQDVNFFPQRIYLFFFIWSACKYCIFFCSQNCKHLKPRNFTRSSPCLQIQGWCSDSQFYAQYKQDNDNFFLFDSKFGNEDNFWINSQFVFRILVLGLIVVNLMFLLGLGNVEPPGGKTVISFLLWRATVYLEEIKGVNW